MIFVLSYFLYFQIETLLQNQHTVRHKILVKDEDLSSFSPPPSDSSDSETEFSMKNKVKTYSKKKTISLDDFVDMNKSIFGNKPDFPQESFKAIDEKRTLMIPENITSMRNECVKSSILEIKVEQTDDTQNLSENITSMHNEFVESPILEIKVEQIDDTQNLSEEVDPLADNKLSLSPKQILPKTNLKDNKILPNKRFVKVVTKEELEKLKIKGLVKVSKNQALNIKKNSTKPEEKSMKVNILVQKAPIMNKSDFTHSKTNEDKKLPSNKIISKKNPYVKLTRIDAQIFKKELQVSKIHADKIISKSPLKVI